MATPIQQTYPFDTTAHADRMYRPENHRAAADAEERHDRSGHESTSHATADISFDHNNHSQRGSPPNNQISGGQTKCGGGNLVNPAHFATIFIAEDEDCPTSLPPTSGSQHVKRRCIRWSLTEEERLCELWELGWTDKRIAESLGRSENAVRQRRELRRLLTHGARRCNLWSPAEEERLRERLEWGWDDERIAQSMGRSENAVRLKRQQRGFARCVHDGSNKRTRWSRHDSELLDELTGYRWTDERIAKHMGKSRDAVSNRRHRQGLPTNEARRSNLWSPAEEERLRERLEWGWTAPRIAESMGRTKTAVKLKRRRILARKKRDDREAEKLENCQLAALALAQM